MNIIERIEYNRSLKYLVKEAVKVLGIDKAEAKRRVLRVAGMEELKELGAPDKKEYQIAVDIIMQIPSSTPITKQAMQAVVDKNQNKQ